MSDSYDIQGVTLTPLGGGYYELKHASLPDPGIEKVQGKEKADARAVEIAKAATPAEGHIEAQGSIADAAPPTPEQDAAAGDALAAVNAENAELKEKLAQLQAAAEKVVTVVEEAREAEEGLQPGQVPATLPREYSGKMDPAAKKLLEKAGFKAVTIILEENESIPPTGLFIGHNGRSYIIQPGEEVDVPDFLLGVLDDAVMSSPITDPKTQKVLGYRNRSKYPYRRVSDKG